MQAAYVTSAACGITQPLGPSAKGEGPLALSLEVPRIGQGKQKKAVPYTPLFPSDTSLRANGVSPQTLRPSCVQVPQRPQNYVTG